MTNLLAATSIPIAPSGGFRGFGSLGLEGKPAWESDYVFTQFLSSTIGLLSIVAVIWLVFLIIIGGYGYMTAGGDKARIEKAQKTITNGIIGLAIVVFAIFVINLIGYLLGIPSILSIPNLFAILTNNIVKN